MNSRSAERVLCPSCGWRGMRVYVVCGALWGGGWKTERDGFGLCRTCQVPIQRVPNTRRDRRDAKIRAESKKAKEGCT